MKVVIQRVSRAEVRVDGQPVAAIGDGLLLLVGIERDDTPEHLQRAARKIAGLRVFEDDQGKLNLDLEDVGGEILAVSQFTLAGSLQKGRRPSFGRAMPSESADPMFEAFVAALERLGVSVQTGVFGATMEVDLVNHGPVTLLWDDE